MNTLLLDTLAWDLAVDASGNIAMASEPYALAQDAASSIKLFAGELYFDTTQGIPYFTQILGQTPPISLMKTNFNNAALTVPGVEGARCFITSITNRAVNGQVQIEDTDGNVSAVGF